MENLQEINQEELARNFEIEELEERLEFGSWSGEASGGYSQEKGAYIEGTIKYNF